MSHHIATVWRNALLDFPFYDTFSQTCFSETFPAKREGESISVTYSLIADFHTLLENFQNVSNTKALFADHFDIASRRMQGLVEPV